MYLRTLAEIFSDTSDMGVLRILAIGVFLIGIVYLVLSSLLDSAGSVTNKSASLLLGRKSKHKKKRNKKQSNEQMPADDGTETEPNEETENEANEI